MELEVLDVNFLGSFPLELPCTKELQGRTKRRRGANLSNLESVTHGLHALHGNGRSTKIQSDVPHIPNSEKGSHLLIVATSPYYPKYASAKAEIAKRWE